MKMTLVHPPPPTQTQCQQYVSCNWADFNQSLKLGSWDKQQQQQQQKQQQQDGQDGQQDGQDGLQDG